MNKLTIAAGVFFFVFFCTPCTPQAFAQTMSDALPVSGASISSAPQYPQPGEQVRLTVSSLRVDVDFATITWYKNEEKVLSGVGTTAFTFTAENSQEPTIIRVVIASRDGIEVGASTTLQPAHIALVWEANTYTPPFYTGKPLQSPGSSVTIHAIPFIYTNNGATLSAENLLFEWASRKDNSVLVRGMGLDTVTLTNPDPFLDFDITLRVYDTQETLRTMRTLSIPTKRPEIVLYPKSALRGVDWNAPIGKQYAFSSELLEIVAEPFFYSANSRFDQALTYEWKIGSTKLNTPGSIFLSPEGAGSGASRVSLKIQHNTAWRQLADTSTVFSFDTTQNNAVPEEITTTF